MYSCTYIQVVLIFKNGTVILFKLLKAMSYELSVVNGASNINRVPNKLSIWAHLSRSGQV